MPGQLECAADDFRRTDDADDAGAGDAADADVTHVGEENLLRGHGADQLGGVAKGQRQILAEIIDQRHQQKPGDERAGGDDGRVLQADDVAQSQHGGADVDAEDQLPFIRQPGEKGHGAGGKHFTPPVKGADDEIIQTADDHGFDQHFGLTAARLAGDQHFGSGCGLGKGKLSVHFLDEIFAERDHKENAEKAA